jgi:hypothetical protein
MPDLFQRFQQRALPGIAAIMRSNISSGCAMNDQVPSIQRPFVRGVGPHVSRGHDIQEGDLAHATGVIERQSMGCSRSPIVTGKVEAVVTERGHHLDLVLRHHAERVVDVVRASLGWTDAVAVAPKVRRVDTEPLTQRTGDLMPRGMRQRVAVQQLAVNRRGAEGPNIRSVAGTGK